MKKTFLSFDLTISSPLSPRKESKEEEQQRFACLDVSKLDDLVKGTQAKTTKYATKYPLDVFQGNFGFNYYNKILFFF